MRMILKGGLDPKIEWDLMKELTYIENEVINW